MKKYAVGIDLGGTNIRIGIIDDKFNIIGTLSFPSPKGDEREEDVYEYIYKNILDIVRENGIFIKDIEGIGIGIANAIKRVRNLDGSIREYLGIVKSNIKVINGVNFLNFLRERTKTKILLENDVNVAAVGEYITRRDRVSNLVAVYMGTGIGGGVIIERKLYFGGHGVAMEIGHMVLEYDGPLCVCGNNGCWEAISGGVGIVNRAKEGINNGDRGLIYQMCEKDPERITTKIVFDAKREGDPLAERIIEKAINISKIGVVNLINLFDPDILVMGGGLFLAQRDIFFEPIVNYVRNHALEAIRDIPIEVSTLDKWGGVLGAGSLIFLDS